MSDDERVSNDADSPLSDQSLLDMLDLLIKERGQVAAAEALGVNYRTMMSCYDSRRVSRRMRRALTDLRDSCSLADGGGETGEGDDRAEERDGPLERRVATLEEEGRELRELVEAQGNRMKELECRVAELEEGEQPRGDAERVGGGAKQERRHPRQREPGTSDAGVVTLEEQPDEEHAFGQAAPSVAEWRDLRNPAGGNVAGNRVDRARAEARRWELETAMLRDFHLTLPPETEPLDKARREDHIRWRREALTEAKRELTRAKWVRWLRRVLTLGLWWR